MILYYDAVILAPAFAGAFPFAGKPFTTLLQNRKGSSNEEAFSAKFIQTVIGVF